MKLPPQLTSIAAACQYAQTLIDLATQEANVATDAHDAAETKALAETYDKGAIGRGMASGGA